MEVEMLHKTHWKDQCYKGNRYRYTTEMWHDSLFRSYWKDINFHRKYQIYENGEWVWPKERWFSSGVGRYYKRRLSKARRAYAKGRTRMRSVVKIESEVNWKES